MSRQGISSTDSNVKYWKHLDRMERKHQTLAGKQGILETWEEQPDEVQIANHDYIVKLRARVRQHRVGLQAMRPARDFE